MNSNQTPKQPSIDTRPWGELTPDEQIDRVNLLSKRQDSLLSEITPLANNTQVGGEHYRTAIQHWDFAWANQMDFFQYQITKYVTRWRKKGGMQDLLKAKHFLDKYMEVIKAEQEAAEPGRTYVNPDL